MDHYDVDTHLKDSAVAGSYISAKANLYARVGKLLVEHASADALAGVIAAGAEFSRIEAKFIELLHDKLSDSDIAKLPTPMLKGGTEKELEVMMEGKNGRKIRLVMANLPISFEFFLIQDRT